MKSFDPQDETIVKLSDFGLVKEGLLETKQIGTEIYIPLEMKKLGQYTNKVDVWSLACVWYFMEAQKDLMPDVPDY